MASNITPGTQQFGEITNPTGKAGSTTQIGATLTPVEVGRTAEKSAYTTTTNTNGEPIGGGGGAPTPLAIALSSEDFTNNSAMPDDVGANVADPNNVTNPALAWTLTGDNAANVTEYRLSAVDTDAADYVHWNVTGIADTTLLIAATSNPGTNNWTGSPTIGATTGGNQAAIANGWEPVNPGSGVTHNYTFTVTGHSSNGDLLVTSNVLTGTYTGD